MKFTSRLSILMAMLCFNFNDSYAESLMMNGDLESSLKNYQRAVDIATENQDRDIELYKKNLENIKSKLKP